MMNELNGVRAVIAEIKTRSLVMYAHHVEIFELWARFSYFGVRQLTQRLGALPSQSEQNVGRTRL